MPSWPKWLRHLILPLLTGWIFCANAEDDIKPQIVLANGEWEPFLSRSLPHYGFASHIVSEAFAASGVYVEYAFFPWARAESMVEYGQIDGSLLWTQTPARSNFALFSDVVITQDEVLFHLRSNSLDPKSPMDMAGKSIVVPLGSKLGVWERAVKSGHVTVVEARNINIGFTMLLRSRVDAFPLAKAVGYSNLRLHFTPEQQSLITNSSTVFDRHEYRLMLTRKSPANDKLITLFNQGLRHLRDTGKYAEMEADYYKGVYDLTSESSQN
ncbi:substrate-binding periplasmic protein [Hahella ganghwensis]|uniref:substrate-binding periplasmic protein n=1 Tax=Hahella ganghwensis TaxID=286420 RepID=UPI000367D4B6|nr:ABC transporter substrate-binding protein [Hahella ganghwensis]